MSPPLPTEVSMFLRAHIKVGGCLHVALLIISISFLTLESLVVKKCGIRVTTVYLPKFPRYSFITQPARVSEQLGELGTNCHRPRLNPDPRIHGYVC